MTDNIKPSRRTLRFESLSDLRTDVEELAQAQVTTVGNWTFAQILDHLSRTMSASLDGFGFQAPWIIRVVAAPLIKNSFLTNPMKPGFRLPKRAGHMEPPADTRIDNALRKFFDALKRVEQETPTAAHPVFGQLALQEWTSLHLRHAEMHLSFVVPQ